MALQGGAQVCIPERSVLFLPCTLSHLVVGDQLLCLPTGS